MRGSGAMDADQGVAVAAFVEDREGRARAGPGDRSRRPPPRRAPARPAGPPSARSPSAPPAGMAGRGRRDRSDARRRDAPPRKRRASARRTSASRAERLEVGPDGADRGAARCPRTWPPRRRARAPRCRARPSRRTGRARARPCDAGAENREQRLAHAVGGRPRRVAGRRLQPPPAVLARDHAHRVLPVSWPPSWSRGATDGLGRALAAELSPAAMTWSSTAAVAHASIPSPARSARRRASSADFARLDDVRALAEQARGVDVLVNNAGIISAAAPAAAPTGSS